MSCALRLIVAIPLLLISTSLGWPQEPAAGDILTRLKERPEVATLALEAREAHKVKDATAVLMDAFRKYSCDRTAPSADIEIAQRCGPIALSLQALDPDSGTGQKYLVQAVEAFLAEHIPVAFYDEAAALEMRFTTDYEAWAKERGLSSREAAVWETINGMLLLSATSIGDPKLDDLFRRGLSSNALSIVISSVRGLALLHDKLALPQILGAIERFKNLGEPSYYLLLGELRNYNDPEVDRIIAKAPNEEIRNAILRRPALTFMLGLRPKQ